MVPIAASKFEAYLTQNNIANIILTILVVISEVVNKRQI
jgi:hypothetical protein